MAMPEIRHPVVSALYDAMMAPQERLLGVDRQRRRTLSAATGHVLEVGAGTGRNLAHYPRIDTLTAVEPDPHMRRRARARLEANEYDFPVELVPAAGEDLPFADRSFDTAVVCLALCTVRSPRRVAEEIHRVLRDDGRLLLLEHVRSRRPAVTWAQHAATPLWRKLAGGCHLDRPTVELVEAAGFTFDHLWRSGDGRGSFIQGRARPRSMSPPGPDRA